MGAWLSGGVLVDLTADGELVLVGLPSAAPVRTIGKPRVRSHRCTTRKQ